MECKEIEGYENYLIYPDGRVWSKNKGRFLKPRKLGSYLGFNLCKNGETKNHYIHRLVAQTFLDNPNNLPEVNHIDENKFNNDVSNLEWVTRMQNVYHGTGLKRMGIAHSKSVVQIKDGQVIAEYASASEAERITGIWATNIRLSCKVKHRCAGGFQWRYKEEVDKCQKNR